MKVNYAAISKAGRRSYNEDCFNIIDLPEKDRWMGIVCDGMGGHAMGDVASKTVVKAISEYWEKYSNMYDRGGKVIKACKEATAAIDHQSFKHHAQMGTTMVMLSIKGNIATIAHIGDSRCYLLRKGFYDYDDINNIDKDHVVYQSTDHVRLDFGWEVVEKCFFSYRPEVAIPDIVQFKVQAGDRLFLCSDGVYKFIARNILKDKLLDDKDPECILGEIGVLCERDGDDNYTAIMAILE